MVTLAFGIPCWQRTRTGGRCSRARERRAGRGGASASCPGGHRRRLAPHPAPCTLHPAPRRQRTAAGVCGCPRRGEPGSTSALRAEGVSGSTQGDAEGRRGNDPTGGRGAPLPLGADLPLAAPANGAPRPVSATVLKGGRQARSLVFGIVGRGDILLFRRCPGDGGPPPCTAGAWAGRTNTPPARAPRSAGIGPAISCARQPFFHKGW